MIMRLRFLVFLVAGAGVLVSVSCAGGFRDLAAKREPREKATIALEIVDNVDTTQPVSGAIVYVMGRDLGYLEVGRSDEFGEIEIEKRRLGPSRRPVIVICKPPAYGCAAEGVGPINLLEFDEFVIALPPRVVH